jgi:hypothetical protein
MPETPEAIRGLADTMVTRFTPPSFVPGCEVQSIADIDEYTTNNGWIEAIVGGDNQQRVRYYGTPQGVAVNDFVDVEYFPAYKLYRVFGATLGGTASVGGLRVSKVWDSDFGDVAFEAGTVNLTVKGTRTLTIPTDLVHADDLNTKFSFTDDAVEITVGGLSMLKLTEAATDLVEIGDVAGGGDVDINFNNGQMFLQGSDGFLGLGTLIPGFQLTIKSPSAPAVNAPSFQLQDSTGQNRSTIRNTGAQEWLLHSTVAESGRISYSTPGGNPAILIFTGSPGSYVNRFDILNNGSDFELKYNADSFGITIASGGNIGIGVASVQGLFHGYDVISGFLHWEYDGLDATSRTIITNGTGDVLYRLTGIYAMRNSAGTAVSGSVGVANGGTQNITVGADTVTITVAAAGTVTIARSAGSNTIKVGLWLLWL